MAGVYDFHKLQPATYNLSIQYDKEMAQIAKAKIRETKKKALEEAAAEGDEAAEKGALAKIE